MSHTTRYHIYCEQMTSELRTVLEPLLEDLLQQVCQQLTTKSGTDVQHQSSAEALSCRLAKLGVLELANRLWKQGLANMSKWHDGFGQELEQLHRNTNFPDLITRSLKSLSEASGRCVKWDEGWNPAECEFMQQVVGCLADWPFFRQITCIEADYETLSRAFRDVTMRTLNRLVELATSHLPILDVECADTAQAEAIRTLFAGYNTQTTSTNGVNELVDPHAPTQDVSDVPPSSRQSHRSDRSKHSPRRGWSSSSRRSPSAAPLSTHSTKSGQTQRTKASQRSQASNNYQDSQHARHISSLLSHDSPRSPRSPRSPSVSPNAKVIQLSPESNRVPRSIRSHQSPVPNSSNSDRHTQHREPQSAASRTSSARGRHSRAPPRGGEAPRSAVSHSAVSHSVPQSLPFPSILDGFDTHSEESPYVHPNDSVSCVNHSQINEEHV